MCACCPAATHTTWLRHSSRLWPVLCEPLLPLIPQSKASLARRGVCNPVTELAHPPCQGQGMLLLQGEPDPVATWAERGLMPVHVVPLEGWTAVLPAGPSRATAPYDDTLKTFAGRLVPSRL